MLEDWAIVRLARSPRLVFLGAPLGWGKTRIVQEFYERVASMEDGGYWPPSLVTQDRAQALDDLSRERKVIRPPEFEVTGEQSPPFVWLGVHADPSEFARPDDVYGAMVEQLEPHLLPILRRQRLNKAARKAIKKSLTAFLPLPSDLETLLDVREAVRDFADEWREGQSDRRRVGRAMTEQAARLNTLLTTVWAGSGRQSAPPLILVIEDAHYLSEPVVDFLRGLLASDLPILVVAAGWPLDAEATARARPFAKLVRSSPARLREEALDELPGDALVELVAARHPGTPPAVIRVLADRTGGNPYALRLMLLRLRAPVGEAVHADPAELERMPFEIHAQFQQLFWSLHDEARRALAAAALVGFRMPEAVAREGAAAVERADLDAAISSQWLRRELMSSDLLRFLEPLRREAAHLMAAQLWTEADRLDVLQAALRVLRQLLADARPDGDLSLLQELHVHFAEQGAEHDLAGALQSGYELMRTLTRQQARNAMQQLLARLDGLVDARRLSPEQVAEFAVEKAVASRRIVMRADAATSAAVNEALRATERVSRFRPDLRARALLEESRRRRDEDTPEVYDLAACRSALDDALRLIEDEQLDDPDLLHNARMCQYALVSAERDRPEAHRLALAESRRCLAPDGSPTFESLEALSDAAFYAARFDPALSVQLSRQLLAQRRDHWSSETHPRVARVRRDLAVRLVRLEDDDVLADAFEMASSAYEALLNANGPDDNTTINARSARGLTARKYGGLLLRRGEEQQAGRLLEQALDDARDVLQRRRRLVPRRNHLVSQERYAAALAATGDERGIDLLRVHLGERSEVRRQAGQAELRWVAQDLRDALRQFGRLDDAAEVERRYLIDPEEADQE